MKIKEGERKEGGEGKGIHVVNKPKKIVFLLQSQQRENKNTSSRGLLQLTNEVSDSISKLDSLTLIKLSRDKKPSWHAKKKWSAASELHVSYNSLCKSCIMTMM